VAYATPIYFPRKVLPEKVDEDIFDA